MLVVWERETGNFYKTYVDEDGHYIVNEDEIYTILPSRAQIAAEVIFNSDGSIEFYTLEE